MPGPISVPDVVDNGADHERDEVLVAEELLIEEISIDGMCGVY
jgi:mycofactocin precursor